MNNADFKAKIAAIMRDDKRDDSELYSTATRSNPAVVRKPESVGYHFKNFEANVGTPAGQETGAAATGESAAKSRNKKAK